MLDLEAAKDSNCVGIEVSLIKKALPKSDGSWIDERHYYLLQVQVLKELMCSNRS